VKGKIVVTWDRKTEECWKEGEVSLMMSIWKQREYPLDVFASVEYPDSIWDEETIMEDSAGDTIFFRDRVLDVWDAKLKDDEDAKDEEGNLDEEADASVATIDFVKWVRSLPEGALVCIEYTAKNE
jgi:hypothetical protein